VNLALNKEDIDLLVEQIRQIILNKPIKEELKSESEELAELQEAVLYLSGLLSESNEFLKHLQAGELDVKPPGRHNFLAGNLKELHSALKHLTWQANQIANGDYSQKVDFLGDFSASFNSMIHQLAEREAKLKHQSVELSDMVELIKSIVDGLKDWIVVIDSESDEIIYTNQSANQLFYDMEIEKNTCGKKCELIEQLRKQSQDCKNSIFEYTCPKSMKILRVKSFGIKWNNKAACVHCIQDVTDECEYHEQVEEMAYTDELTGLYNRRYCMKQLERQLSQKNEFSFCMIDLDGLKYANDNYGHASGDRYLKTVADEMLKISRTTDIVCRIGGDEFAILFLNCASDIALKKMKQANLSIESLSEGFLMSISYGVIHIEAGMNISPETILKWADKKMYALKNTKKHSRSHGR
jgi:diguanylate cyclase (GGDEF)-like protein